MRIQGSPAAAVTQWYHVSMQMHTPAGTTTVSRGYIHQISEPLIRKPTQILVSPSAAAAPTRVKLTPHDGDLFYQDASLPARTHPAPR